MQSQDLGYDSARTAAPSPGFEPTLIWRDGSLVPFADATTHVLSHMSARGSQIFDVLLVVPNGEGLQAFGLREHVARFARSAETMGMIDLPGLDQIETAVAQTVLANLEAAGAGPTGSRPNSWPVVVKLIAAWDGPTVGVVPASRKPSIFVVASPAPQETAASVAGSGLSPIKLKTAAMPKIPASVLPPSMKVAAGYTPGLRHHLMAADEGFDQVLFRTMDGDLAESVTSSVMVVKDGQIVAPPVDSVLDSITRRAVLEVAQWLDIPRQIRPVRWDEVTDAHELFLSSTMKSVLPVAVLDERSLVAPGPVSQLLMSTMAQVLAGTHDLSQRWMTELTKLSP